MAFLKDLIVNGAARIIGPLFASSVQTDTLKAPASDGNLLMTTGEAGQILRTNGSNIYWSEADQPNQVKIFDDVWSAPLDKTTAEAKAMNKQTSGSADGSTYGGQSCIYFGKIQITGQDKTNNTTATATWIAPWSLKLRITVKMFYRDASGTKIYHPNGASMHDINISGSGSAISYKIFNNIYSWTTFYKFLLNRPTDAYFKTAAETPVLMGINLSSSTNPANSYYKREFTVEIIEEKGCTVQFFDDWICVRNYHQANSTVHKNNSATNYVGYCSNADNITDVNVNGFLGYNTSSNGLQETGDNDTTAYFNWYTRVKAGGQGIHGWAIIGELADGSYASFTLNKGKSSASVIKQPNLTDEFIYKGRTLYYVSDSDIAAGSTSGGIYTMWTYHALDTSYLSNYYGSSASNNPALAFGYSGSGTSAAYTNGWIKVEFTADYKRYKVKSLLLNDRDRAAAGAGYYMLIGANYNSTGEYYRIATLQNPQIYYVDENGNMSLPDLPNTAGTGHTLTIGTYTFDGSEDVTVPIYDGSSS